MEVSEDGEMLPRQAITSSAYALYAEKAKTIDGVSVVPSGAIILWRGNSCPVGYHRVTEMDGKFLVSGATYNPAAGGNNTHTHTGPNHTHSVPNHTHTIPNGTHSGASLSDDYIALTNGGHPYAYGISGPFSTTNSGATTTGASGTANTGPSDSRPEFATVICCEKD